MIEVVLRRDRIVVVVALATITALAWAYVLWLAADMDMGGVGRPASGVDPRRHWSHGTGARALALVRVRAGVDHVDRNDGGHDDAVGCADDPHLRSSGAIWRHAGDTVRLHGMVCGRGICWCGRDLCLRPRPWHSGQELERTNLLDARMAGSRVSGAIVLIAACKRFEWTLLKERCLRECQAPLTFIQQQGGFRRDARGALLLGLKHGAYCLGCCWILMALLFVGGVMHASWIAAIAIFILAEKVLPPGWLISRISGLGFIASGSWRNAVISHLISGTRRVSAGPPSYGMGFRCICGPFT